MCVVVIVVGCEQRYGFRQEVDLQGSNALALVVLATGAVRFDRYCFH